MDKFTVRQWRMLRGWTLKEMSERLDMSIITYRNKELGDTKFYIDEAFKFAQVMGVSILDIAW